MSETRGLKDIKVTFRDSGKHPIIFCEIGSFCIRGNNFYMYDSFGEISYIYHWDDILCISVSEHRC